MLALLQCTMVHSGELSYCAVNRADSAVSTECAFLNPTVQAVRSSTAITCRQYGRTSEDQINAALQQLIIEINDGGFNEDEEAPEGRAVIVHIYVPPPE